MATIRERLNGSFNRFMWSLCCGMAGVLVVIAGALEHDQNATIAQIRTDDESRSAQLRSDAAARSYENRQIIYALQERVAGLERDVQNLQRQIDRR